MHAKTLLKQAVKQIRSLFGDLHGFLFGKLYIETYAFACRVWSNNADDAKVAEFLGQGYIYALFAFA